LNYDEKTLREWIEAIKDETQDKLSSWEIDFIDSVERQLNHYSKLSDRQIEILEKIYAEKTS